MKIKNILRKVIITFISLATFMILSSNYIYSKENQGLIDRILLTSEGKTVEYGIKALYRIEGDGEKECNNLIKNLNILKKQDVKILKSKDTYCLEFNKDSGEGYIESIIIDNHNYVVINITEKNSKNNLDSLKSKVNDIIGPNRTGVKYFQYIKAKLPNSNLSKINSRIVDLLKKENAENIDTVKLENGFSTVAYTKKYELMKSNGKFMDLNYSLCSYSSGDYLILGTPVLVTIY